MSLIACHFAWGATPSAELAALFVGAGSAAPEGVDHGFELPVGLEALGPSLRGRRELLLAGHRLYAASLGSRHPLTTRTLALAARGASEGTRDV